MNCHELCSDTSAATEARIRNVVYRCKSLAPCVLCLRNVDVLGRDRDGAGDDLRVAASFASIINAAQAERAKFPVHIVATTSKVTSVCKDIQQAFLYRVHVDAMTETTRERVLAALLCAEPLHYSVSVRHVAQRTAVGVHVCVSVVQLHSLFNQQSGFYGNTFR